MGSASCVQSRAMASLLLGPLLRYVGRSEATVWVETDRKCTVGVLGRTAGDVRGLRAPLRARGVDGPGGGCRDRVRGGARRGAGLAARRRATIRPARSTPARASARRGWCLDPAASARPNASRTRCRRRSTSRGSGWTPCGRTPDGSAPASEPWPDGLLLIGDQVYADEVRPSHGRVHPLAPRRVTAARRGGRGLRGVRLALPRGVERPRHPLAALDRAERDDLRRPRRDRRLEHLVGLGRRTSAHSRGGTTASPAPSCPTGSTSTSGTWRRRSWPTSRCTASRPPAVTSASRCRGSPSMPTVNRPPRGGHTSATSGGRACWSSTPAPRGCSPMAAATWWTTRSGGGSSSTAVGRSITS